MGIDFIEKINNLNKKKKNTIAVGLLDKYPETIKSLKIANHYTNLIIVGPYNIDGFECIQTDDPDVLIRLVKENKVNAVFRGNFDAIAVDNAIRTNFNYYEPINSIYLIQINRVKTLKENISKVINILPVSPSEDVNIASKIQNIDQVIRLFNMFEMTPQLGVLSAGKTSDVFIGKVEIDKTLVEAEFLVNWYKNKGYNIKHFNHQIEYAIIDCNIIICANAITGNQVLRTLSFFGYTQFLGSITTTLPFIYGQIAQSFREWDKSIILLNAYLNKDFM